MRLIAAAALCWACCAPAQTMLIYSRQDAGAVRQAQALAAAYGDTYTAASLRPGEPWRPGVARLIMGARTVLLLWSEHAAASPDVAAEWRIALAAGARVVPVRLDAAPMPPELAALQWVDWSGVRGCAAQAEAR